MQAEMGNKCQKMLFKIILAEAVAKRNAEVSGDNKKQCVLSQVLSNNSK